MSGKEDARALAERLLGLMEDLPDAERREIAHCLVIGLRELVSYQIELKNKPMERDE
jgi:hypothetical protein